MKRYSRQFRLTVIAYCLLPNHYHFLVRQDGEARAGLLPQRVFNSYTKAYNRRYGHSGTLFEDNYKVKHVKDKAHLLNLCRYIHANPVLHGIVAQVEAWPYSNYLEWVGERDGTLVDREFITTYFATPEAYREYVEDYVANHPVVESLAYLDGE
jgi:REP element-mobilizing transposase RayT